jgi:hypothetical protein
MPVLKSSALIVLLAGSGSAIVLSFSVRAADRYRFTNRHIQHMDTTYASRIADLERVYGKANDTGFGSAVFSAITAAPSSADSVALQHYRAFLGSKLTPEREAAWMGAWKQVYTRPKGQAGDILAELGSLPDAEAKRSVPLLIEFPEDAAAARAALSAAFNHPAVTALSIYRGGDGEAISGLAITAIFSDGNCCSVIVLMD